MDPGAYVVAIAGPPAPLASLAAAGLRIAHDHQGVTVWISAGAASLPVIPIDLSLILIGDVYGSPARPGDCATPYDVRSLAGLGVAAVAERLIAEAWGRYILIDHGLETLAAFRDPSGALDCVTWRAGGRRVISAHLPRDLDALLPTAISIDWTVVAHQLRDPIAVSGASALRNLVSVPPGGLWLATAVGSGEIKQLWRPAVLARRRPLAEPAHALRDCVQTCVATLAQPYQRRLVEISGGLDSAIVASALDAGRRGPDVATRWINFAPNEAEGDERRYARAVASSHGLELTERPRAPLRYDEASFAQVGADFRVGLTALDPDYDADLTAQALAFGAEVLITGQGGDAVFLQMATHEALADRLRLQGRIELSELLAQSRRWRRSLWRTLADTIRMAVWAKPPRRPSRPYLASPESSGVPPHPWLEGIGGLPPAKAAQVHALVASQNVFGTSRRSQVMRCVHPLLSQPVVELVLAIPSFELTRGGEDRALARDAFADGLPEIVRSRRSKGSMQAFYGRAVAGSLDVLRPWLLEGELQREGLVRRDNLEALLDPDVLIMTDAYVEILHVAAVEAWVRGWSERITTIKSRPLAPETQDCPSGN